MRRPAHALLLAGWLACAATACGKYGPPKRPAPAAPPPAAAAADTGGDERGDAEPLP